MGADFNLRIPLSVLPVTYVVIFAWSEQRTYKGTTKLIVLLLFLMLFNLPLHHLLNINV